MNIQTIMIILTKNTWFHWLFWRMKWHIFSRLHDEKIWVLKRQFYKQDASTVWQIDAIQVANICKRLYRLHDDFFEILIFRAWERKIRWQKTQMTNQQTIQTRQLIGRQMRNENKFVIHCSQTNKTTYKIADKKWLPDADAKRTTECTKAPPAHNSAFSLCGQFASFENFS